MICQSVILHHTWVNPIIVTNNHTHHFISPFCNHSLVIVVLLLFTYEWNGNGNGNSVKGLPLHTHYSKAREQLHPHNAQQSVQFLIINDQSKTKFISETLIILSVYKNIIYTSETCFTNPKSTQFYIYNQTPKKLTICYNHPCILADFHTKKICF